MGKLTKEAAKLHRQADALTRLDRDLTEDERLFVLEHWQESADTTSVLDGAFFTPMSLASEVAHHVHGHRPTGLRRPPLLGNRHDDGRARADLCGEVPGVRARRAEGAPRSTVD